MREFEYTVLPDIQQMTQIPNGESLFNSIVVFENYPIESVEPYGVRILDIASHEETNYDLTLVAVPGDTLELRVTYRFNQYTEKQIQSLMQQLIHTLEAMTEQVETPLSDFTMVTNEEKERMITDWSKNAQVSVLYPDQEEVYSGVHDPSCETEIFVLSEEHQLIPVGFSGDIFIGAKDIKALCGELADWMETHKIPHPFKHQTGEYLYPTGDVGVWTEKTRFRFWIGCRRRRTMLVSRRKGHAANHIVRINGKRIDLKALEQVMMLHFPLKECVLIPKKNQEGSLSLVLFAQAKDPSLTREDLMKATASSS